MTQQIPKEDDPFAELTSENKQADFPEISDLHHQIEES
jgi:hypothetical protein